MAKFIKEHRVIVLGGLILLLAIYLFSSYIYTPLTKELKRCQKELSEKEAQLRRDRELAANLPAKREERRRLKEELSYVEKKLPKEKEMPDLLKKITIISQNTGVEFTTFTPQMIQTKTHYEEVPIALSISGTYHNLGIFLSGIGNLPRILIPSDLQISASTPTEEDPSTIKGSLKVTAFVFRPSSPKAEVPGG